MDAVFNAPVKVVEFDGGILLSERSCLFGGQYCLLLPSMVTAQV